MCENLAPLLQRKIFTGEIFLFVSICWLSSCTCILYFGKRGVTLGIGYFWNGKDLRKVKTLEWWKVAPGWKGLRMTLRNSDVAEVDFGKAECGGELD